MSDYKVKININPKYQCPVKKIKFNIKKRNVYIQKINYLKGNVKPFNRFTFNRK